MKLSAVVFLSVCLLAQIGIAQSQSVQRGPSTPEERQRIVSVVRALEADLRAKDTYSERQWALRWLIEVPDISVKICSEIYGPMLQKKNKLGKDLLALTTLASAAFIIQRPDQAKDQSAVNLSALESALRAYQNLVRVEPEAKSGEMDALLEKQQKGELPEMVRAGVASCQAAAAKGNRLSPSLKAIGNGCPSLALTQGIDVGPGRGPVSEFGEHDMISGRIFSVVGCAIAAWCAISTAHTEAHTAAPKETKSDVASIVLGMERAALDRWGKGDPDGFLEITDADVVYFDPFQVRLTGIDQLRKMYDTARGKIKIDKYEIVDPVVMASGDIAVLTFNFVSHGSEGAAMRWNTTEVYRRRNGQWRIIHTHWSLTQPKLQK